MHQLLSSPLNRSKRFSRKIQHNTQLNLSDLYTKLHVFLLNIQFMSPDFLETVARTYKAYKTMLLFGRQMFLGSPLGFCKIPVALNTVPASSRIFVNATKANSYACIYSGKKYLDRTWRENGRRLKFSLPGGPHYLVYLPNPQRASP